MFTVQISDRATFARKAKSAGLPVSVVRGATVIPVERGGAVIMHPAATIDYALEFDDPQYGPTRWTFREVVLTDERGEVLLSQNLWSELSASPPARVILSHRSGSF